jgi:hypothetical protein
VTGSKRIGNSHLRTRGLQKLALRDVFRFCVANAASGFWFAIRANALDQRSDFFFVAVALGDGVGDVTRTLFGSAFLTGNASPDLVSNIVVAEKCRGPVVTGTRSQVSGPAVPEQVELPFGRVVHSPLSPFLEGSQLRVQPLLNVFSLANALKVLTRNSRLVMRETIIFMDRSCGGSDAPVKLYSNSSLAPACRRPFIAASLREQRSPTQM